MWTKPHVIGFLGLDSYDLILYLAGYLNNLGQKILIADYSIYGGLSYCIPSPVSLNPDKERIRYKDIDFIRYNNESIREEEYHYILIDFGWNINYKGIFTCDFLYITTDLQQQNMNRILDMNLADIEVYILIKNFFHMNNITTVKGYLLENNFTCKDCYLYPSSQKDMENMVMLQYYHDIKINNISRQLRNLIETMLIAHLAFDEKEVIKKRKINRSLF